MEIQGEMIGFEKVSDGVKKDGTKWVKYKYSIASKEGKRTLSGFIDPSAFNGKYVIITYNEVPNPQNSQYPFKNVMNIVEGVSPKDFREADEKYHVTEPGKEKPIFFEDRPDWDMIHDKKKDEIMRGRAVNNAIKVILHSQDVADKNMDKETGKLIIDALTLDKHFITVAKKLYDLEKQFDKEVMIEDVE